MDPKKKRNIFAMILVFSAFLILAYDLIHIWRNRPKACDLKLRNCPSAFVCSAPADNAKGRCIPRASEPPFSLDIPFASGAPVHCLRGNQDGEIHTTDFNLFALELRPEAPGDVKLTQDQQTNIVAAQDGYAFVDEAQKVVRILHRDGYYSVYGLLESIAVREGQVRSGDLVGKISDRLRLSVHYINPQGAPDVLQQAKALSLSVPFSLRYSLKAEANANVDVANSDAISCNPDSGVRLFRANIPL